LKKDMPILASEGMKRALAAGRSRHLVRDERCLDKGIETRHIQRASGFFEFWWCRPGQDPRQHALTERARNTADRKSDDGASAAYDDEDNLLTDRQRLILETMFDMDLDNATCKISHQAIVNRINPQHDANNYKRDFATLHRKGLTGSVRGPDGGVWLTN